MSAIDNAVGAVKKAAKDVDKKQIKDAASKAIDSKVGDTVVKTVNKVAKANLDKSDLKDGLNKVL